MHGIARLNFAESSERFARLSLLSRAARQRSACIEVSLKRWMPSSERSHSNSFKIPPPGRSTNPYKKNSKLRQTAPPEQLSFRGMKHTVHVQKPSPLGPCRLRESGVLWSLWNLTIPSRRSMLSRSNAKRYRTLQFCEESQVSGPEAPRSLTPDRGTPPRPGPEASARQGRAPAEPASPVGAYAFFRQRGFGSLE